MLEGTDGPVFYQTQTKDVNGFRQSFYLLGLTTVLSFNPVIKYFDYHGPRGDYAVIDGKRVPLDYTAARRIALQAHLLALGNPERAAQMVAEAERAKREQITA